MAKAKKYDEVMTPEGVLVFPQLNVPDKKYKKEFGEWSARIRLTGEAAAALVERHEAVVAAEMARYTEELEVALAAAKTGTDKAKAKKALAEIKEADKPFRPVYDDEGEETGDFEFNFKSPAGFLSKKDGKPVAIKIAVFDAGGKQLKTLPKIWGGTVARLQGYFKPFATASVGVGASLRLQKVQILRLVTAGEGAANPFGKADGYTYEEEDEDTNQEANPSGAEEGTDEENF